MSRSEITTRRSLAGPVTRSPHQQAVAGGLDDAASCSTSIGSRRSALRRAKVPASPWPISRLYPATSAEDGREPAFDRSPLKVLSLGRPAWSVGPPRQVCPSDLDQSTMDQLVLTHRAR